VRSRADRSLARTESSSQITRARGARRWPWVIAAFAVAIVKGEGYASLIHHRGGLIVLLAVALGFSLLRPKPLLIAAFGAALVAFALAPHPAGLGVALGFGAFVLLIGLFFAIATVLHARQPGSRRGRPA
jgi:hypothetical protein